MLFAAKPPVDRDELEWLLACFAWLHRTLGERDRRDGFVPVLVLPDDENLASATTAVQLFEAVKRLAGLQAWHCLLEKGNVSDRPDDPSVVHGMQSDSYALGTFSVEGNSPVIRYHPALLKNPDALVATFAHELAHLLIADLGDPPGGQDLHEHATDCAAVYLGFGVFLANGARNFEQFQDAGVHGWQSNVSGYLSENALVTLLAVFQNVFPSSVEAKPYLKTYLQRDYARAEKYFKKTHPDLGEDIASFEF